MKQYTLYTLKLAGLVLLFTPGAAYSNDDSSLTLEQVIESPAKEEEDKLLVSSLSQDNPLAFDEQIGKELDCLIEPYRVIEIATSSEGIIEDISVDRGDFVDKGQVITKLESRIEKVNLNLSRAKVKFNDKKYKRMKKMFQQSAISTHERDEAETEKHLAELEYKRSAEILDMRTIKSPLSGVVVERYISAGEYVEQEKIIKVAQIDPLNIEVIAPVTLLGMIKKGETALVYPEGPIAGPLKAEVKIVDKVVDAASGTFGVRLQMTNKDKKVSAGLKCRVKFE